LSVKKNKKNPLRSFTFKTTAVYAFSAGAVAFCEIARLDHKVLYYSMKLTVFVVQLFACDS